MLEGSRCICGTKRYYDVMNAVCLDCHYSCLYCSGPSVNQCDICDRWTDLRILDNRVKSCLCVANHEENVNGTCEPAVQVFCE